MWLIGTLPAYRSSVPDLSPTSSWAKTSDFPHQTFARRRMIAGIESVPSRLSSHVQWSANTDPLRDPHRYQKRFHKIDIGFSHA